MEKKYSFKKMVAKSVTEKIFYPHSLYVIKTMKKKEKYE